MTSQSNGEFKRKTSQFRFSIPSAEYRAEAGRYILYMNHLCPWVHRTLIVRSLKGLEDIIETVEVDSFAPRQGWTFSGKYGPDKDPITGLKTMREIYEKYHPGCLENGIASVPVLFDKKSNTIVNNESSEIIRMFYHGFDSILPRHGKPTPDLFPAHLRDEIEAMNTWVYEQVNNGTYRAGFATTDEAYSAGVKRFYDGLNRLEEHLANSKHQPYLFGEHITEADVRLYPTILRFDVGYVRFFNRRPGDAKLVREQYLNIDKWLRTLYWDESEETNGAFKKTVNFAKMREGMTKIKGTDREFQVPDIDILPSLVKV